MFKGKRTHFYPGEKIQGRGPAARMKDLQKFNLNFKQKIKKKLF